MRPSVMGAPWASTPPGWARGWSSSPTGASSSRVGSCSAPSTQFETRRLEPEGALDTTFGDGGSVRTDLRDGTEAALDVALDAEGRIVVAGRAGDFNTDFALVRYLPDGSVDPGFADDGQLYVDFFMLLDIAESVAIARTASSSRPGSCSRSTPTATE